MLLDVVIPFMRMDIEVFVDQKKFVTRYRNAAFDVVQLLVVGIAENRITSYNVCYTKLLRYAEI